MTPPKVLQDKFFADPDWKLIEDMVLRKVDELKNFDTIDTKQTAETVKAEVIGRRLAYTALVEFLEETKLVGKQLKINSNPFK